MRYSVCRSVSEEFTEAVTMCGARAAFAHINHLLAMIGGAKLVACAIVLPNQLVEKAAGIPGAEEILMIPYVAGPLLFVLTHLGVSALHAAPRVARLMLVVYACCSVVLALAAGALLGWAGSQLAGWLRDPDASARLKDDEELRAWLRPMMAMVSVADVTIPKEDVRADVVVVLVAGGATLLLLLASAALALAARPRRARSDEQALRPCSSLYYEPSAPAYKTPMQDSEAW